MIGTCQGFDRDQSLIVVRHLLSVLHVLRKSTSWRVNHLEPGLEHLRPYGIQPLDCLQRPGLCIPAPLGIRKHIQLELADTLPRELLDERLVRVFDVPGVLAKHCENLRLRSNVIAVVRAEHLNLVETHAVVPVLCRYRGAADWACILRCGAARDEEQRRNRESGGKKSERHGFRNQTSHPGGFDAPAWQGK